jgi:hypothetical protein
VSFIPNLVDFTDLKKPINLKSPIALRKNIIAIARVPYMKYVLLIYLSKKPRLAAVIIAKNSNPKATIKVAAVLVFFQG